MTSFNLKNPAIPIGTVLNTNFTSSPIPLQYMLAYAIQIFFTGTPTGTFSLNVSADPAPQANATGNPPIALYTPTHWSPLENSSFIVAAAGSVMWNYEQMFGYKWVQVAYADGSSGSSTATITSIQVSLAGG